MYNSIHNIATMPVFEEMQPILLSEMTAIKLMNRVDTKFVASQNQLLDILSLAKTNYRVQVINNIPVSAYDSVYFDTKDADLYHLHHNRKLQRQKIRTRRYIDSDLTFLEIKNKTNTGRTKKARIEIDGTDFTNFNSNINAVNFVSGKTHFPLTDLHAHLQTSFSRITLVNNAKTERLTIDTNLQFVNLQTQQSIELPKLMVIELKQDGQGFSQMKSILQNLRIKPISLSKYCIGMALTNPAVKSNHFKEKLVLINKKIR